MTLEKPVETTLESTVKNKGGNRSCYPSMTYGIKVGCGKIYITITYDEKGRFKRVFIPRTSKFHCPIVTRDGLARLATYGGKRSIKQTIRDLRGSLGHYCDKYNITCQAYSCQDAVSKVLNLWKKRKRNL